MCARHRELHDVGRVGAEHHQLAVRHVDDAHDAERDRQADGDEHEHRSEAQAEEQRLDRRVEASRPSRCAATRDVPRPAAPPRRFRRSCRPATVSSERRQPVADVRLEPARQRARWPRAARPSRCRRAPPAPGRCRSPSSPPASVSTRAALAQQRRRVGSSSERSMSLHGVQPHATRPGSTARSARRRPERRAAGGCWCRSSSARRGRPSPRACSESGSISSSDGSALVGGLDDEDLLVAVAEVEPIFEERREHRPRARMAARDQPLDDRFLVGEAGLAQLAERGRNASSGDLARERGDVRRRAQDAASSSQRSRCPPDRRLRITCSSVPSTPSSSCCSCRTSASPSRLRCPCCPAGSRTTHRPAPCRSSSRRRRTGRRRAPRRCRPAW